MSRKLESNNVAKEGVRKAPSRLSTVSQLIADKSNAFNEGSSKNNEALVVAIEKIQPNPNQPRQVFDEERDLELAENIRENGILEPIIVREIGEGRYEIVAGERRYRAAKAIDLARVPVIVKDYDDKQAQLIAAVENLQRVDLDPLDEARYFRFLCDTHNYSYQDIATMIHRSRSYVNQRMRELEQSENGVTQQDNSEERNKHPEIARKLEKSQSNNNAKTSREARFTVRPLVNFDGWLDNTTLALKKLKPDEKADLRDRLAELRHKIAALEEAIPED